MGPHGAQFYDPTTCLRNSDCPQGPSSKSTFAPSKILCRARLFFFISFCPVLGPFLDCVKNVGHGFKTLVLGSILESIVTFCGPRFLEDVGHGGKAQSMLVPKKIK